MKKADDGKVFALNNIDAELEQMCIELMRVKEKATELRLDLLVYLADMCIDEVREQIGRAHPRI